MSQKYTAKKLGEIIDSQEPVFILRAQDKFALSVLNYYTSITEGKVSPEFSESMNTVHQAFLSWQLDNKDKVKVPD